MSSNKQSPILIICLFEYSIEDKCSLCDVHAHCEDGKCVCDNGYYGEGTKDQCQKPSGEKSIKSIEYQICNTKVQCTPNCKICGEIPTNDFKKSSAF